MFLYRCCTVASTVGSGCFRLLCIFNLAVLIPGHLGFSSAVFYSFLGGVWCGKVFLYCCCCLLGFSCCCGLFFGVFVVSSFAV